MRLSHPDKVYFPERGLTKLDVARYYLSVGDGILRALRDRPTTLERYPDGVERRVVLPEARPEEPARTGSPPAASPSPAAGTPTRSAPPRPAAVLWAANLGCLTFHPWPVRRARHRPPRRAAHRPRPAARHRLRRRRARRAASCARCWTNSACTAGPRPPAAGDCTSSCRSNRAGPSSRCAAAPSRSAANWNAGCPTGSPPAWWKEERGERIFVDYNQTARDRTIASAYSVRPRPHAPVSAPLRWEEVPDAAPARLRPGDDARALRRARRRARRTWTSTPCGLEAALELAARDERDHGLGDLPYPPDHPKMAGEPRRVQPSRARH